eukprot:SAG11_NODE_37551_length_256_cov_0.980892_1_plen_52_part_01
MAHVVLCHRNGHRGDTRNGHRGDDGNMVLCSHDKDVASTAQHRDLYPARHLS